MRFVLCSAFAVLAAACGTPLTDGAYQGESLFQVGGIIQALENPTGAQPVVTLVWVNFAQDDDTISPQTADVTDASFPASFTLDVYDAPAEAELNDVGAGFLGTGFITVFGEDQESGGLEPETPPLGLAYEHVVLYARALDDADREMLRSEGLVLNPEALSPGFNLARTVCGEGPEVADHLEVIAPEDVRIDAYDVERHGCLDFF